MHRSFTKGLRPRAGAPFSPASRGAAARCASDPGAASATSLHDNPLFAGEIVADTAGSGAAGPSRRVSGIPRAPSAAALRAQALLQARASGGVVQMDPTGGGDPAAAGPSGQRRPPTAEDAGAPSPRRGLDHVLGAHVPQPLEHWLPEEARLRSELGTVADRTIPSPPAGRLGGFQRTTFRPTRGRLGRVLPVANGGQHHAALHTRRRVSGRSVPIRSFDRHSPLATPLLRSTTAACCTRSLRWRLPPPQPRAFRPPGATSAACCVRSLRWRLPPPQPRSCRPLGPALPPAAAAAAGVPAAGGNLGSMLRPEPALAPAAAAAAVVPAAGGNLGGVLHPGVALPPAAAAAAGVPAAGGNLGGMPRPEPALAPAAAAAAAFPAAGGNLGGMLPMMPAAGLGGVLSAHVPPAAAPLPRLPRSLPLWPPPDETPQLQPWQRALMPQLQATAADAAAAAAAATATAAAHGSPHVAPWAPTRPAAQPPGAAIPGHRGRASRPGWRSGSRGSQLPRQQQAGAASGVAGEAQAPPQDRQPPPLHDREPAAAAYSAGDLQQPFPALWQPAVGAVGQHPPWQPMPGGGWAPYYPAVAGYQLPPGYPDAWAGDERRADGMAPVPQRRRSALVVLAQQAVPVGLTPAPDHAGDQLPVQSVRIKTAPPEAAMKIKEVTLMSVAKLKDDMKTWAAQEQLGLLNTNDPRDVGTAFAEEQGGHLGMPPEEMLKALGKAVDKAQKLHSLQVSLFVRQEPSAQPQSRTARAHTSTAAETQGAASQRSEKSQTAEAAAAAAASNRRRRSSRSSSSRRRRRSSLRRKHRSRRRKAAGSGAAGGRGRGQGQAEVPRQAPPGDYPPQGGYGGYGGGAAAWAWAADTVEDEEADMEAAGPGADTRVAVVRATVTAVEGNGGEQGPSGTGAGGPPARGSRRRRGAGGGAGGSSRRANRTDGTAAPSRLLTSRSTRPYHAAYSEEYDGVKVIVQVVPGSLDLDDAAAAPQGAPVQRMAAASVTQTAEEPPLATSVDAGHSSDQMAPPAEGPSPSGGGRWRAPGSTAADFAAHGTAASIPMRAAVPGGDTLAAPAAAAAADAAPFANSHVRAPGAPPPGRWRRRRRAAAGGCRAARRWHHIATAGGRAAAWRPAQTRCPRQLKPRPDGGGSSVRGAPLSCAANESSLCVPYRGPSMPLVPTVRPHAAMRAAAHASRLAAVTRPSGPDESRELQEFRSHNHGDLYLLWDHPARPLA
ncbi:hypothetical protein PLESTM_000836900 [Pleodorina starrii]|nr:hypothetical protein PLESTM_000836900 [Pleodorina starrii]